MAELEGDVVYPSDEVVANARVTDHNALLASAKADPQGFWAKEAGELEWFEPWDQVLDDSEAPFYQWFTGAKTNIVHNCLDRHLSGPRKNKLALIWQSEDGKEHRTFSYFSLNRQVNRMANIIKSMGVGKGDRVTIYLPRIPEVFFAMLACAKIGAVHSVVFAGFSSDALHDRIEDSESKLVITADGSWVNGSVFPLKKIVDEAVKYAPTIENVIVVKRTGHEVNDGAAARPLVPRPHRAADRQRQVPDRGHGRRGPALHPVHVGLDRKAEGDPAHPRRLHGGHLHHPEVHLRRAR